MKRVCKRNRRLAVFSITIAALLLPDGASAEVVTLASLEALALENQANWEAAAAETNEASAELDAARAGKRPSFWMNVSTVLAPGSDIERVLTTDGREVNVRASPTVTERTAFRPNVRYEGTIDMRAPLYDGRNRAAIKAAEAYRAAAEANTSATQETVRNMVRATYLDWLGSFVTHGLATRAAEEARAQRARTEQRVADGDRAPSELDAARYEELQAELVTADARARLDAARRLLESAVGSELSPEAEPDRSLLESDVRVTGQARGWEVEALERQRDAVRQEARMHRKSRVPVLAVIGQTGLAGVNNRVFPMYRLGLSLAVPLWDGGRALSLARAADANATALDARARDAHLTDDDQRRQALLDHASALEQLELADDLVSVSETRVGQAQSSYELGAGDLEAVASAREALRDARSHRVQIQIARVDAAMRIGELD